MGAKTSPAAAVFAKVLRAFETGGFTCPDVLAEVELLLATGASPTELLEILRRRELIEPLPQYAHAKVFDLLNDAKERAAANAAVSDEAQNAVPDTAPEQTPDSVSAPPQPTSTAPPIQPPLIQEGAESPAKAASVALTSVFKKVFSAPEAGGFTDTDVLAQLQRLLIATGSSPKVLLEILRRRKLIEPLPEYAYAEVLGLLNDAMGRVATHAAVSDEARNAEPEMAIDRIPDLVPAPIPSPSIAPPEVRSKGPPAKATTVALTSPRNPDLTPTATPNRTTDSAPAMTPIQIAISKQAARLGSARSRQRPGSRSRSRADIDARANSGYWAESTSS